MNENVLNTLSTCVYLSQELAVLLSAVVNRKTQLKFISNLDLRLAI